MRFNCISKFCNSLIGSNSVFKDVRQRQYSMTHPMFLIRKWRFVYTAEQNKDGKASLRSERYFDKLFSGCTKFVSRLMCANGLFCLWNAFVQPVVICNPSTREVRFLPQLNVDSKYVMFSLGFEPEENKYKLLMTSKSNLVGGSARNWVFSLGIDESWRETKTTANLCPFIDDEICINGVIYQLNYIISDHSGWNIIAFDVKDENFRIIQSWISPLDDHPLANNYMLTEVKGKLAVIDYGEEFGGDMDLWILGKTHGEWEKHIIAFPLQWTDILFGKTLFCVCTHHEGEIVFALSQVDIACRGNIKFGEGEPHAHTNELSYLCYDVTRKCWREFESQGLFAHCSIHRIYVYAETLFSLFKFSDSPCLTC